MAKLTCKNCGTPYKEDQLFCDQCGKALPLFSETEPKERMITCPLCKRRISEKLTKCPYCGEEISLEKLVEVAVTNNRFKTYTRLGLVLSIFAFFTLFSFPLLSLVFALIGLLLSIVGYAKEKTIALWGIVLSTLGLITTVVLIVLVIGFDFHTSFLSWSLPIEENKVDEYINPNTKYKGNIYTSWLEDKNSLLVLKSEGTFTWYQDSQEIDNNFQSGIFQLENGIVTDAGKIFEDDHYYYYQLTLFRLLVNQDGKVENDTFSSHIYTLGIDKDTKGSMSLKDLEEGTLYSFVKTEDASIG